MRSALPRLVGPCALRSAPWSLKRGFAPVSTAMSSSCSEISSPNPGALTATAFTTLLTTFSTSVASASPSMSLATISRGLFCWTLASRVGRRSCAELIVWSVRRTRGLSWTASLFSLSVIMYGLMYPLLNSIPSTTFREVSIDLASSTVMTPSLPTASTASAISDPISSSLFEAIVATCLIVSLVSTGTALSFRESTTVSIALSNPAFSSTGLEPDSMFFRP